MFSSDHHIRVQPGNATYRSSIGDLPNEILALIFYAGTKMWSERPVGVPGLPFPLLVSSVSAHWRLLAQSIPNLWSYIIPPLHKEKNFCISETQKRLARSGSLPITVVMDARVKSKDRYHPERSHPLSRQKTALMLELIFCIAESALTRLWTLEIHSDIISSIIKDGSAMEKLSGAINLEQFALCMSRPLKGIPGSFLLSNSNSNRSQFWDWSTNLPNLRNVRVRGYHFPYHPNLTSLTVYNLRLSYHGAQTMFSSLPNLETLVLEDLCPIILPLPSQITPINAHSLRRIAVSCTGNSADEIYLFKFLSIPNLTHLELDGSRALAISAVFGLSLSGTRVETLRLSNSPHTAVSENQEDLRIFQSFETLQHLQIAHAPMTAVLSLTTTKQLYPWPALRIISLDTMSDPDLAFLCEFTGRHKGIETLELSKLSMRHLSEYMQRHGDEFKPVSRPGAAADVVYDRQCTNDVREWLAARVHLTLLSTSFASGLLDANKQLFGMY